jgi:hypothetical protein
MGDEAAVVDVGSTGATGVPGAETILGETSGSGETQAKEAPPEKTSTGIARPSWMTAPSGPVATESKTAPSGSTATAEGVKDQAAADGTTTGTEGGQDGEKAGEKEPGAKPPPGYVPTEAVRQARGEARFLRDQLTAKEQTIATLEEELAAAKAAPKEAPPARGEFDNFRELSEEELEELADEDPVAVAKYAKDLVKYKLHQADKADREAKQAERAREMGISVSVAKNRITEILPDDAANDKMVKFAIEAGMSPEVFVLTDPDTKIVVNGELRPLGNMAANVVETLAAFMAKHGAQPEITIDMVPEAIQQQIIAKAQEDIVNKVKNPTTTRSVSSIPSVNRTPDGRFAGKSYGQLSSPAEREAYLRGEG